MKRGVLQFGGSSVQVWLDIQDGEIRASSVRPKESVRFRDFTDKYRAEALPQMKPASQASIKSVLGILNQSFGDRRLADIGTEEIQKFVTGSSYSPKTLKNQIGVFRMAWNKARAWNYVKHNPFEFLSFPRSENKEQPFFTPEQCCQIVEASKEPYRTIFMLCANTGLRAGEALGLSVSDIDFEKRMLYVRKSSYRGQIQSPKTGNAMRCVKLADRLCLYLRLFLQSHTGEGLMFPKDYESVRYELNKILVELGIYKKGMGMHCFRRLTASAFSSIGAPDAIVQKSLGHATISMSQHYMRPFEDDRSRVAEQVWEVLSNAPRSNVRELSEKVSKAEAESCVTPANA